MGVEVATGVLLFHAADGVDRALTVPLVGGVGPRLDGVATVAALLLLVLRGKRCKISPSQTRMSTVPLPARAPQIKRRRALCSSVARVPLNAVFAKVAEG